MSRYGEYKDRCKQERTAFLHTLNQGTAKITVTDLMCPQCWSLIVYDEKGDGLVSASEFQPFTKEFLDFRVMQVTSTGYTYGQAYSTYRMLLSFPINEISFLGIPLSCSRRFFNTAFQAYLEVLDFPSKEKMNNTFSYSTFENTNSDVTKSIQGIVMDGTAVELPGKLRKTNVMNSLFPNSTFWNALDSSFVRNRLEKS